MGEPIIELVNVAKGYGGAPVVGGVGLKLYPGEVHALLGENGAGKSTLVKIFAGVHRPDTGRILFDGLPIELANPHVARAQGIAVIHQHPALFGDLDVVENIFVGHLITRRSGHVDWRAMRMQVKDILHSLGVSLPIGSPVRELSMAQHQLVEIAKALSFNARVLVMDEPTAALTPKEVQDLFDIARHLRDRGVALLFISHRLEEIFDLCDRVTVLRDGAVVGSGAISSFTKDDLVRHMVGRDLSILFPKTEVELGEVVLEARNLTRMGAFRDISFSLRAGEILALTGLVGAGRTEVARALIGVDKLESGKILMDGEIAYIDSPAVAVRRGIAYVPEDRHVYGLIMDFDVVQNVSLTILKQLSRAGVPEAAREYALAKDFSDRLKLKAPSLETPVSSLSGGNQQKVVLSKGLASKPRVLILDEPTRGVDIGAKVEVHRLICELAAQGLAILMISSEMPEVLSMADNVMVMHEGLITARIARNNATQEKLMYAAAGITQEVSDRD